MLGYLQQATRSFWRRPGFTITIALVLALGIGSTSAIFSILDSLLLEPLPVEDPGRVVAVFTSGQGGNPYSTTSYPDLLDLRREGGGLEEVAAFSTDLAVRLESADRTERLAVQLVTPNYFSMLGIRPAAGRLFLPEDGAAPGERPVAVLRHELWRDRFGADPQVIGSDVRLNGLAYTVVGVAPPGFQGVRIDLAPDLWLPVTMQRSVTPELWGDLLEDRGARWLEVVGRLSPGGSAEQSEASLEPLGSRLRTEYPVLAEDVSFSVLPISEATVHPTAQADLGRFVTLLAVTVLLILVISFTNAANLMMARAAERQQEISTRVALGSSRGTLLRQLLTEGVVLSVISALLGLLVTFALLRLMAALDLSGAVSAPISAAAMQVDQRVLAFSLALALAVGLVLGAVPVAQTLKINLHHFLKQRIGTDTRPSARIQHALVMGEVALSVVLLVVAVLFLRSLTNLQALDPGFTIEDKVVAGVDLRLAGYEPVLGRQVLDRLAERVEALSGVQSVGFAALVPVDAAGRREIIMLPGMPYPGGGIELDMNVVGGGYFTTMGIPLLAGRTFAATDTESSPAVAVINETMARQLWPDEEAVGKRFSNGGPEGPWIEVVGIVADSRYRSLREDSIPYFYLPMEQVYQPSVHLVARTGGSPASLLPAVRREIHDLDPDVPLFALSTLEQHLGASLARERLASGLLILSAALALFLAAFGLYGVLSYLVARRTREIGIRVALGAEEGQVMSSVLRRASFLIGVGIALGLLAAAFASGLFEGMLYGVSRFEPLAFVGVPVFLGLISMLASYLPARRASRVDPTIALRFE